MKWDKRHASHISIENQAESSQNLKKSVQIKFTDSSETNEYLLQYTCVILKIGQQGKQTLLDKMKILNDPKYRLGTFHLHFNRI